MLRPSRTLPYPFIVIGIVVCLLMVLSLLTREIPMRQQLEDVDPPTHAPTERDTSRFWHLLPPPSSYSNIPSSALLREYPLCKFGDLGHAICLSWLDSMSSFNKRRSFTITQRRRDQLNQWPSHRHGKCPSIPSQPIRIWVRDWHEDWGHVYNRIANTNACPQNCLVSEIYTPEVAIVLDTNTLGATVEDLDEAGVPPLTALLEMANNDYHYGPWVRDRDMMNTDILVTYSRLGDVWVNYMYGWEECVGPGGNKLDMRHEPSKSFLPHFDRCLPVPPTIKDLTSPRGLGNYATRDFVGAFISGTCSGGDLSPNDPPGRLRADYLRELLLALERRAPTGRNVVNYGNCHPRQGRADAPRHHGQGKVEMLKRFKFTLAFEAELRHDYVTEQMYHAVIAGTIPVVFAGPEVVEFLPGGKGSYIYALDFATPDALAKYLVEVDSNHNLYMSYFDWRWDERKMNPWFAISNGFSFVGTGRESLACRICVVYSREYCGNRELIDVLQA